MGLLFQNCADKECLLRTNIDPKRTSLARMVFLCMVVVSPGVLAGMCMSFSGIALPQMNFDINDESWFSSIPAIGSAFGSVLIGTVVDRFGRRPAILLGVIPSIIGWCLLATELSTTATLFARFLMGITGGTTFLGQIYTAECILVNHVHLRNNFNTWDTISTTLGQLFTYILACVFTYKQIAVIIAILAIFFFITVYGCIPESPDWLHKHGFEVGARLSEQKLRIYQPVLNTPAPRSPFKSGGSAGCWLDCIEISKKLRRRDVYKPMYLMTIWFGLIMFSGGPVITAYMVDVLHIAKVTSNSSSSSDSSDIISNQEYRMSVISGICSLAAVVWMTFIIGRTGVKKLFVAASLCMAAALFVMGILQLATVEWTLGLNLIHTVTVWLVLFFYYFGVLTVAGSVIGEMFPHDAKGFACVPMVGLCFACLVSVKLHPYAFEDFHGSVFLLYSWITVMASVFVLICIPETVGKNFEEIREEFLK